MSNPTTTFRLSADAWFNTPRPLDLNGRSLLLYAFQMLCPRCVEEATPLAIRVHDRLPGQVIGLHTVFENHEAMGRDALAGYISRAGIRFPVAIDQHDGQDDAPITMRRLLLMGTPSFVTVDQGGVVRERLFGVPTEEWLMQRMQALAA